MCIKKDNPAQMFEKCDNSDFYCLYGTKDYKALQVLGPFYAIETLAIKTGGNIFFP